MIKKIYIPDFDIVKSQNSEFTVRFRIKNSDLALKSSLANQFSEFRPFQLKILSMPSEFSLHVCRNPTEFRF